VRAGWQARPCPQQVEPSEYGDHAAQDEHDRSGNCHIATHLADLATFVAIGLYSIAGEANPVARELFQAGGLPLVVAVKVAGALVAALIVARRRQWLWLAAGSGLLGALTTLVALA
jgi:hypothetical protein